MKIEFDPSKRNITLANRGLDFADAALVFAGATETVDLDPAEFGEQRHFTVGRLHGRMVVVVWTQRGDARRIISMRKANDREQRAFGPHLD